jgi:hypothetical protein
MSSALALDSRDTRADRARSFDLVSAAERSGAATAAGNPNTRAFKGTDAVGGGAHSPSVVGAGFGSGTGCVCGFDFEQPMRCGSKATALGTAVKRGTTTPSLTGAKLSPRVLATPLDDDVGATDGSRCRSADSPG